MRIAKDGKQFDIDILGDIETGDVEIIQFLRPNGKRRRMLCYVGEQIATMAENQVISVEELTTGEVAIHSRFTGQPEESEKMKLATNGPGEKAPDKILSILIKEQYNANLNK